MGMFVETISWNTVRDRLAEDYLPVLPVGAASKEHGFHLPMNADAVQVQWLLENLIQELNILVWPIITYGYYPAFIRYCGSVSLSRKTFKLLLTEIIDCILYHGPKKIVLLNSGVSTISPLVELSVSKKYSGKLHLCNIYQGKHFLETQEAVCRQLTGGHADETETSIMLAISPDCVDSRQAQSEDGREFIKGALQPDEPNAPNYSHSGAMGDPTQASEHKGHELLNAIHQDVSLFLDHVMNLSRQS